jgi:hypothetical protein
MTARSDVLKCIRSSLFKREWWGKLLIDAFQIAPAMVAVKAINRRIFWQRMTRVKKRSRAGSAVLSLPADIVETLTVKAVRVVGISI